MIAANKGGLGGWLVARYVEHKLRSAFRGIWVGGALPPAEQGGLLVYANHTNFWDGFVAHGVARAAGWSAYCAMEERNLARYRFLTRLGAFSIPRSPGSSALASLRYAAKLLAQSPNAVFLFPEGVLRPMADAPATLERGVELLARMGRARCVPMAFRYLFAEHELPDVLVQVGPPHQPGELQQFQRGLGEVVQRLFEARSLQGFKPILRGRRGVAERWDGWRGMSPSTQQMEL